MLSYFVAALTSRGLLFSVISANSAQQNTEKKDFILCILTNVLQQFRIKHSGASN